MHLLSPWQCPTNILHILYFLCIMQLSRGWICFFFFSRGQRLSAASRTVLFGFLIVHSRGNSLEFVFYSFFCFKLRGCNPQIYELEMERKCSIMSYVTNYYSQELISEVFISLLKMGSECFELLVRRSCNMIISFSADIGLDFSPSERDPSSLQNTMIMRKLSFVLI